MFYNIGWNTVYAEKYNLKSIPLNERRNKNMSNVNICDITDEVKTSLKEFRFSKSQATSALILKVDREKQEVVVEEKLENTSIDEVRDSLPGHQPRFIVISYKQEHGDGRISFPLCFVFYTPRDSHTELQIMYAGTKLTLQRLADLARAYEVRELDEFTDEWLLEKLGK